MTGFAHLKPLDWDTNHFGFKVWSLNHCGVWGPAAIKPTATRRLVSHAVEWARRQGIAMVYARIPLEEMGMIHALEAAGFHLMEIQVLLLFDLTRQEIPQEIGDYPAREYRPDDESAITELARHAYTATPDRFHADPHFPAGSADELYAEWIKNSCSGEAADLIAVVDVDGRVGAYGTLRYWDDQQGLCNMRLGQFLIGAVAEEFKERGLIKSVMAFILNWIRERGGQLGYVGTQANNIASLNSMVRLGFRPVCSAAGMHLWLGN